MSDFHIDPIMQQLVDRTKEIDAQPAPTPVRQSSEIRRHEEKAILDPSVFTKLWELNPEFYELMHHMAETHNVKAHDYCGTGADPLANLMASEELGLPAWKGCIVRMMDKWGRIKNFCRSETLKVKGESFEDTLLDNAVYSLLNIILFRRARRAALAEEEIAG